ncbi:MAG TPA: glycosyltransferase family 4 protein [Alphaproteobacteria bacterium]|nr:glycosyltransferase family 4 protein [Alphaproteobacteria bacterium]
MRKPRILFLCHNHPSLHAGGTEIFAHDLFREFDRDGLVDAMFLGCTNRVHREQKPGTNFQTVGRSANEVVMWTGHFDRFFQSQIDLHGIVPEFAEFLRAFRPDVVHFHHTLLMGVETLFLVRRTLPDAKIVLTLHDYYSICTNDGQMVTTGERRLCSGASPDACHRCFPGIGTDQFLLRERHIKNMLSLVDVFVAPSAFLRDRYIAWGLDPSRIVIIRNGLPSVDRTPHRFAPLVPQLAPPADWAPAGRRRRFGRLGGLFNGGRGEDLADAVPTVRRDAFGYFGNVNPFKGATVALDAARRLRAAGEERFSLRVHGGMAFQTDAFKAEFAEALDGAGSNAVHLGPYQREDVPDLMLPIDWVVVPSIWWENAPLVILEAFHHRRPVICSGIGGMAEMVQDGVNGLHVRPNDPHSLMEAMDRAINTPGLWDRLVSNIRPVPTITDCMNEHLDLYEALVVPPAVPALTAGSAS